MTPPLVSMVPQRHKAVLGRALLRSVLVLCAMALRAKRDAVGEVIAKTWRVCPRLNVVGVHALLLSQPALLTGVVVAEFHLPGPSHYLRTNTMGRFPALPVWVILPAPNVAPLIFLARFFRHGHQLTMAEDVPRGLSLDEAEIDVGEGRYTSPFAATAFADPATPEIDLWGLELACVPSYEAHGLSPDLASLAPRHFGDRGTFAAAAFAKHVQVYHAFRGVA